MRIILVQNMARSCGGVRAKDQTLHNPIMYEIVCAVVIGRDRAVQTPYCKVACRREKERRHQDGVW